MLRIIRQMIFFAGCLTATFASARSATVAVEGLDGLGQTIQIQTHLRSFIGKPIWTLIIRDLDHGQNIPYVFDFTRGDDHWVALTFSRNYLITASKLQIVTPYSRFDLYKNYRISNFCNLESMGRIIRGRSMTVQISGDLSPNSNDYTCSASSYPDGFFIAKPE